MNASLAFLLSSNYHGSTLHPEHVADLRKSGLTDQTIQVQYFRSVPPGMISQLLGFNVPTIASAMLIPFPAPGGGFMNHIRVRIFPAMKDRNGHTIKYLQPKKSAPRLFFPLLTLDEVLHGDAPLWAVEGEKKALAVAQLGLRAVGFCGIEGWHSVGLRTLLPDFDVIPLRGRTVELVPDGDVATNPNVYRGAVRLVEALETQGARVRLVQLPTRVAA